MVPPETISAIPSPLHDPKVLIGSTDAFSRLLI